MVISFEISSLPGANCALFSRSECMRMPQRRCPNRRWLPCERRCELCIVRHRIHSQPRQDSVCLYVCSLQAAYRPMTARRDCHSHLIFPCVVNGCTCHNGVGATGTACPAHGAVKCASCNAGFTLNHDSTACTRTCLNMYPCACMSMYVILFEDSRLHGVNCAVVSQ